MRYESLFLAYYDQAIAGNTEAAKMVVGIMDRVAKINGVIPDKSLVTVDQRAMKFNEPVTFQINPDFVGIDELGKKAGEENTVVSNLGSVFPQDTD